MVRNPTHGSQSGGGSTWGFSSQARVLPPARSPAALHRNKPWHWLVPAVPPWPADAYPSPSPCAALPHYTEKEWDWLRGALATVDRNYGILTYFHHRQVNKATVKL